MVLDLITRFKYIFLILFLFSSCEMYVTEKKTVTLSGKYIFFIPAQYYYITPYSYVNRFGVDVSFKRGISLMGGGCFTETPLLINTKFVPELWVRCNLIQLVTNKDEDLDLTFMVLVSKDFYYGLGLNYQL